jgi:thiosulfate reductase cytochrome b subunit
MATASFPIRLWHFVHALLFVSLLATGWHLYYGGVDLWGYALSVRVHERLGSVAAVLALAHPVLLLASGRWRDYRPPFRGALRAVGRACARYTIELWRGAASVSGGSDGERLNPVQRLLYFPLLFVVLPALATSGLALLAPRYGIDVATEPRERALLATTHAALALGASLFLLVHLYMASMTAWQRILPFTRFVPVLLAAAFLRAMEASAAPAITLDRSTPTLQCVGCHSGTAGSRRIVVDPRSGARKDVTVELARLQASVHGRMECRACHSRGFERFPHRAASERRFPACRDCHPRREPAEAAAVDVRYDFPRLEREHTATAHAASFRKERGERDCEGCHHPHYMRPSEVLRLPERLRAEHDGPCRHCHEAEASGALADPLRPDLLAGHAAIPYAGRHLEAVRCIDCHASRFRAFPHDLLSGRAAEACVDCHRVESALLPGLWRYVPGVGAARDGYANGGLLAAHYVMAATRPVWLDRTVGWSLGALALALAGHATFRLVARLRRSKRRP